MIKEYNMENVIYGLINPNTKELRYIGYTNNIKRRYKEHLNLLKMKTKTHKNNWIKSLLMEGLKPEIIIIEEYSTPEELPQAEIEMVEYFKWLGCDLTNGTKGGDGMSPGHKNSLGKKASLETKMKMSKAHKGNKCRLGQTVSLETKMKMSLSHRGKIFSQESKDKIAKSHIGITHSEETKQKLSVINKGKTWKLINGKRTWMEVECNS